MSSLMGTHPSQRRSTVWTCMFPKARGFPPSSQFSETMELQKYRGAEIKRSSLGVQSTIVAPAAFAPANNTSASCPTSTTRTDLQQQSSSAHSQRTTCNRLHISHANAREHPLQAVMLGSDKSMISSIGWGPWSLAEQANCIFH